MARMELGKSTAMRGVFAGITATAASIGSSSMRRGDAEAWYAGLDKPWFAPRMSLFRPSWSGLHALIALSGFRVWRERRTRRRGLALGLWGAQILLGAAWYPLIYRRRSLLAGLVEALALAGTTAAYTVITRRVDRPAALLMLPYLGWLGYVGVVNAELWRRNEQQ